MIYLYLVAVIKNYNVYDNISFICVGLLGVLNAIGKYYHSQ